MTRLEAIKSRLAAARQELHGLCNGSRKFTMCIPPMKTDSDLVIGYAFRDSDWLIDQLEAAEARVKELRAENERLKVMLEAAKSDDFRVAYGPWLAQIEYLAKLNGSLEAELARKTEVIKNAHEYALEILPHLGEIHSHKHPVEHAEHFTRQALAWLEKALTPGIPGDKRKDRDSRVEAVIEAARGINNETTDCARCMIIHDAFAALDEEEGK